MSVLNQLKLTTVKARVAVSPVQMRRNKLLTRIDEQIAMAKAMGEGRTYAPSRTRIVKNKETGESRTVEQVKRVKPWWWQGPKGLLLQVKYGTRTLMLGKGQNAVEVPSKGELVTALSVVRQAIDAGELDAQLDLVAAKGGSGGAHPR